MKSQEYLITNIHYNRLVFYIIVLSSYVVYEVDRDFGVSLTQLADNLRWFLLGLGREQGQIRRGFKASNKLIRRGLNN